MTRPAANRTLLPNSLMTLLVIGLTLFRRPELFQSPRFFAEEGTDFFAYAYSHSFLANLLHPQFGYYTLYNVFATSLAATFPLENAPLVTTCAALAMQLLVSGHVIWGDLPLLDTPLKRGLVAVSLPLFCPGQIWLTTIGVQYWLCIATALVLLETPATRLRPDHWLRGGLLVLTGLTGILSCLLTPLFLYRWITARARQMLLYGAVLALCSLTQLALFLQAFLEGDGTVLSRFGKPFLPYSLYDGLVSFFYPYLLNAVLFFQYQDSALKRLLDDTLLSPFNRDKVRDYESLYLSLALVAAAIMVPLILRALKQVESRLLVMAVLVIYIPSIILSINSVGGPRYAFAPRCLLLTAIVAACDRRRLGKGLHWLAGGFIAVTIVAHVIDFRVHSLRKAYREEWPVWREEVAIWRTDPTHALKIWPPPWTVSLPPTRDSRQ